MAPGLLLSTQFEDGHTDVLRRDGVVRQAALFFALKQGLDDGENCIRITRQGTRQRVQQVEEHSLKSGFEAKLRVAVLKRLLRVRDQILHLRGALEAKKEVGASEQALGVELVLEQRSVPILAQHNILV